MSSKERTAFKKNLVETSGKLDHYERVKTAIVELRREYNRCKNHLPPARYYEVRDMIRDAVQTVSRQTQPVGGLQKWKQDNRGVTMAAQVDNMKKKEFETEWKLFSQAHEKMEYASERLENLLKHYKSSNEHAPPVWYRERKEMVKTIIKDDKLSDAELENAFRTLQRL